MLKGHALGAVVVVMYKLPKRQIIVTSCYLVYLRITRLNDYTRLKEESLAFSLYTQDVTYYLRSDVVNIDYVPFY